MVLKVMTPCKKIYPHNKANKGIRKITVRAFVGPMSWIKRKYNKQSTALHNKANAAAASMTVEVTAPGIGENGREGSKKIAPPTWEAVAINTGLTLTESFLVYTPASA